MRLTFPIIIILLMTVSPIHAGSNTPIVELTIYPAKALKENTKYQLFPKVEEQNDIDAFELYNKAIESLPENVNIEQIDQWLRIPLSDLPSKQIETTLLQFKSSLQLVEQAVHCKECIWPFEVEVDSEILSRYRKIAYILALQARFEMAQGQYDRAVDTIQAGLVMGKNLSKSFALTKNLIGIAVTAVMLGQIEQFIQLPDGPNLYWPLEALPNPLIDMAERLKSEEELARKRIQELSNRLERHVALLQCIEALRHYSATHDDKLPTSLAEVKDLTVPSDLATQKEFIYEVSNSKAALKGPAPQDSPKDKPIYYKITLKNRETEK